MVAETISNKPNAVGTFTLSGADSAVPGARTVTSQYADGDQLTGRVQNTDASMFEEAVYQFTASGTTLTRVTVTHSSNANAAVDFSGSATALVFTTGLPAKLAEGAIVAINDAISGLKIKWSTAMEIKIESGFAYVEQSGVVVELTSEQTINPTLSASAWHYVYLKTDGTCEVSTTAPVVYSGAARSKNSAGQKYRLLGQFKTDASSNIYEFTHKPESNSWFYPRAGDAIYRVLSNGKETTPTQVALSNFMPSFSTLAWLKLSNTDTGNGFVVGDGRTTADSFFVVAATVRSSGLFITNSAQQGSYFFSSTPTGGAYIDIMGYVAGR